jgi:agmatinase
MNKKFNPNAAAKPDSGLFGLDGDVKNSKIVVIPVPWEVTTSYGGGTSRGPQQVLEASAQVDLFDTDSVNPYEAGICMLPINKKIVALNQKMRKLAQPAMKRGGFTENDSKAEKKKLAQINQASEQLNEWVYAETKKLLKQEKIVGVVGGDHSVPFGAMKAMSEVYPNMGVLHVDAHSDTRIAYEGFEHSHASIFHNVLTKIPEISKIVQIGIRDFCEEEVRVVESSKERMVVFLDQEIFKAKAAGRTMQDIAKIMVQNLPSEVYVSFDVDGFDPKLCPGTGTPVPGGLEYNDALLIFREIVESGRKIIGFDVNETSNANGGEWNANVSARLLYKLCSFALLSNKLVKANTKLPPNFQKLV